MAMASGSGEAACGDGVESFVLNVGAGVSVSGASRSTGLWSNRPLPCGRGSATGACDVVGVGCWFRDGLGGFDSVGAERGSALRPARDRPEPCRHDVVCGTCG